jgi:hypothetical protein
MRAREAGPARLNHRFETLRIVAELVEGEQADVGPQLLVEEVLQLERAAALLGVGGIERRLGEALLERGDYLGRVADRPPLELQHREGDVAGVAGEPHRGRDVGAGDGDGAADVRHPLVVERPAHLLAVVRDVDVPESGFRIAHCALGCAVEA